MTTLKFHSSLIDLEIAMKRFAYQLTTNKEDAEDLVQDTYLKALKNYTKYVYESNLKAWTFTIMKNSFINSYRRSLRQKTISDQSAEGHSTKYVTAVSSFYPESEYTSKEIERTIEDLKEDFKIPFKMYNEGFRYKEIAESLDIKLGTVKSRIFLARKQLRELVNS